MKTILPVPCLLMVTSLNRHEINYLGFDTAVEKAAEASCAHIEAVGAPGGIGLVKVMGRNAGFIAAEATLASRDVNFVLIPESPFDLHGEKGLLTALQPDQRAWACCYCAC